MLDATSIVLISFLIVFSIAFISLASFAFCRLLLCREKTREGRSSRGRTQSFYGSPSPIPDQREYLDVSTVREPRESRRRDRLSPPVRDRGVSKGRISVLNECPFASAPPLGDPSQYSPVNEVFMYMPPQLRRTDRY